MPRRHRLRNGMSEGRARGSVLTKCRADGAAAIVHQPMAAHALIPQQAGKQPNPTSPDRSLARPPQ
ncbi:hypothetical protein BCEP4_110021 [Burkholderia cepacia]|nr:hypothetical protein BCEP4_110021 [Burkholderia cepacia]